MRQSSRRLLCGSCGKREGEGWGTDSSKRALTMREKRSVNPTVAGTYFLCDYYERIANGECSRLNEEGACLRRLISIQIEDLERARSML